MRALQRRKTEDDCNKAYDDDNVTDNDIIVKWSIFKERCGSSDQERHSLLTKTRMEKNTLEKTTKSKKGAQEKPQTPRTNKLVRHQLRPHHGGET